jgi:DNA-binding transcriptional ArsR family regulator
VATRSGTSVDIETSVLEFCWGLWSELGVSGWGRTHDKWAIDVEPLIVFTAEIGDRDPRLRDEALDWCIRYSRLVSVVRLRNVLRETSNEALDAWRSFAATVNVRAGVKWPGAGDPLHFKVTGRSTLRPLTEPAMTYLRIRSIFGVAARAEILRCLLYNIEFDRISVQMLADETNYGKRIVAEAAESLAQAGILRQRLHSNRNVYELADRKGLQRFIGAQPRYAPEWNDLLLVVRTLLEISDRWDDSSAEVLRVEIRRAFRRIEAALARHGIAGPKERTGVDAIADWDHWAGGLIAELAAGDWPGEEVQ